MRFDHFARLADKTSIREDGYRRWIVSQALCDTPVPFSPPLERAYRPTADKIAKAARELAAY